MDVNQQFVAHNIDLPPAALTYCAAASLTNAAAQAVPPGSTVTSLTIEQGHLACVPGKVLTLARVRFTGDVANVAGQTATVQLYRTGVAVAGTSSSALATTAGVKTDSFTFTTPVTVAVGDVIQAVITPSGALTAVLTGVMVAFG